MAVVAVTGATGFIGRHVVSRLVEQGHSVRTLVRNGSETRLPAGVSAVSGEVTDAAAVGQALRGAETVIHLAGVAHTTLTSDEDRNLARAVNVNGTSNVLEAASRLGTRRVVLASSAHVYDGQRGLGVRESAPQAPENLYAQTKIEVEKLGQEFAQRGLEVVTGRPCLTYGPSARFNLFKLMQAIDRGIYFHVGTRRVERSFASVYSAAAAFVHLAEKGTPGEAYNIADREPMLLEDFTNDLADRMKRPHPRHVPYPLLWPGAATFSAVGKLGIKGPLTLESLRKLTESFSLNTDKLASTGFAWPDNGERAREDMVKTYLAGKSR
ncbi:MAG TPA: NAD-dependent epimerase/dehydratase family protein [Terriglobales bacterium]|nr:NAD-dependent epimerase/dehydratase family protein [Terriglobales bacterium]